MFNLCSDIQKIEKMFALLPSTNNYWAYLTSSVLLVKEQFRLIFACNELIHSYMHEDDCYLISRCPWSVEYWLSGCFHHSEELLKRFRFLRTEHTDSYTIWYSFVMLLNNTQYTFTILTQNTAKRDKFTFFPPLLGGYILATFK